MRAEDTASGTRPDGPIQTRLLRPLLTAVTCLVAAMLVCAGPSAALIIDEDAPPGWSHTFTGSAPGEDRAADVASTAAATWVAGEIWNGTTKLDASLVRIPTPAYPEVAPVMHSWNSGADNNDANYTVAARGSYVYTAGATRNADDNLDLTVIRWSAASGAFKWVRRFAGAARLDDRGVDVVIDPDGNVVVCGTTEVATGRTTWVVLKYSPSGARQWKWAYAGSTAQDHVPAEMSADAAGNVYVTGYVHKGTLASAYTVKLSSAGKTLWSKTHSGPEGMTTQAKAIARCPSGGVYVGGSTTRSASGLDMFLVRYSVTGKRKTYDLWNGGGGSAAQVLNDLAVASTGDICGVGQAGGEDPTIAGWDPAGAITMYGNAFTTATDQWVAAAADPFGGVYVTGPYDSPSVNPNIRTWRFSRTYAGGGWRWDDDSNGFNRTVSAIAVSSFSAATRGVLTVVVGDQYNGADYDQYVRIWRY